MIHKLSHKLSRIGIFIDLKFIYIYGGIFHPFGFAGFFWSYILQGIGGGGIFLCLF